MRKTTRLSERGRLDASLGAEGRAKVLAAIDSTNWYRARFYLVVVLAFEGFLLLFVDIPSIRSSLAEVSGAVLPESQLGGGEALWLPLSFMAMHLGLIAMAGIGLFAAIRGLRRGWRSDWGITAISSVCLLLLGAIGGLDQLRSGDINSWALSMVIVAVMFSFRWPQSLLAFLPSSLSLAAGILLFQSGEAQRVTHLVNDGIYSVSVIVLSSFLYGSQYSLKANSTLLEMANARLDHLSHHDQLTGLPNRRGFMSLFDRELRGAKRSGEGLFVAVCDIDSFKQFNDREGHPAGDELLRALGSVLGGSLRPTDVAARWGGEEYLLLLRGNEDGVAEALERIRRSVAAMRVEWKEGSIGCTLSFGFAEIRQDAADPLGEAYQRADAAMYRAKAEGKNAVRRG
jgi:diguanylate cyclase (GGDEF)-like protein